MSNVIVLDSPASSCPISPDVALVGQTWRAWFGFSALAGDDKPFYQAMDRLHGSGALDSFIRQRPYLATRSVDEQIGWFVLSGVPRQTSWFRDPPMVRALREFIVPSLCCATQRVSIASVGCADGIEGYSFLLALWRYRERITITGLDVNRESLIIARSAVYRGRTGDALDKRSCLPIEFMDRSLADPDAVDALIETAVIVDRFQGRQSYFYVRSLNPDLPRFEEHDILRSPLARRFHVISLLKVLMHYPLVAQRMIVRNVLQSLFVGGWLLVDSSYTADDYMLEVFRQSGFVRVPVFATGWWGGPEDITYKVVALRRIR